jgi:hypothetical protein
MRLRDNGLSSRKVGGEVAVFDLGSSRDLELLCAEHDRDELGAALQAAFEIDEDMARLDVDAFIADLSDAGLLSH